MKIHIDTSFRPDPARRREILQRELGFGRYFTDRMYMAHYTAEKGWHGARIVPFEALRLSPGAAVLHYGQAIFEGQKAYHSADDEVLLFRPHANARRFALSARRLVIPPVPEDDYVQAIETLLDLEREWVPRGEMQALYVRPVCFASEALLGVRAAKEYLFLVILSPVGAYYETGFRPVKILVSEEYVRAAPGGTGEAKAAGNYGASLAAGRTAQAAGCQQVLWLDAVEHRYVEEIGAMNIMAVIDGRLITPPLTGTILPGVTRDTVLTLAKELEIAVEERPLAIDDLIAGIRDGRCSESFGCGTAAVISAIGSFMFRGQEHRFPNAPGPIARRMLETITDIQWGRRPDSHGWVHVVPRRSVGEPVAPPVGPATRG
jgi:branched-chain amino acid aminotransferase